MKNKYMIKSKVNFDNLFLKKKSFYSSFYIIHWLKTNESFPRFAISISKKNQKKAVHRNKARRQIKSIIRNYSKYNKGIDLIIIVKNNFFSIDYLTKKNELENILDKIFK